MRITKIIVNNIRNHRHSELEFSTGLNIFQGLNGAGKTSILEAISVCGMSRSFLPVPDASLINKQEEFYLTRLESYNDLQIPYKVNVKFENGHRKQISSSLGDNLSPKDIIGELPLIILSPDFKSITIGSPSHRREFIDRILSQANKLYIEDMLNLKKCLKQRNNLLNQAKTDFRFDYSLIETWTDLLIKVSTDIVIRRNNFIKEFIGFFKEAYRNVTNGKEDVELNYIPDNIPPDILVSNLTKENLINYYNDISKQLRNAEIKRGTTLFGPQKDELEILINGSVAKEFASQGQHKSLLISLKFAEFNYLKNIKQETPVILLDDIFSELDSERSKEVFELVLASAAQTFITVTDSSIIRNYLNFSDNCYYFKIVDGLVKFENI
jgi:DNA replication and repair protein RecF